MSAVEEKVEHDDLIDVYLEGEYKIDPSTVPLSYFWPSMLLLVLATEAVAEDNKRNYKEALRLYKASETFFLHAINKDAKFDDTKDEIRKKLKQYQDRAAVLTSYLDERRRIEKLRELTDTEMAN